MAESTPTKTITRSSISPNSKTSICAVCLENVQNFDYRRKLFSGVEKTKACINLEIIVGAQIDKETGCNTDIVCRNCDRRNDNLVKKILNIRDTFYSSQSKLVSRSRAQIVSIKRQSQDNMKVDSQIQSGTKRVARGLFADQFISETTLSRTDKETQTLPWPDDCNISAVHVSIQSNYSLTLSWSSWSNHKNISSSQICFNYFPLIFSYRLKTKLIQAKFNCPRSHFA